ncbi:hypothetical protein GGI04_002967 [Coemansia thaxteri]|uniref:Glucose-6-phosphate 1-epimerase n=1 Tax=Coemansia thaxteri TaxID=2663907 RepID=A0A9W8EIA1_9FUNG|nr:hypothetical protein GGI04_002967 [Coemansia thaxteri]KAJ2008709.1 hypothetical protein H4R26_000028 [Coemansia thaxteri]KAJ2473889.1 hypothetical protein GGI02_000508 [Coemansia sp. RSA 2322]KAJ2488064.1 hypothetical protein EV174_000170 [Coemansia sp. RSA 2320]
MPVQKFHSADGSKVERVVLSGPEGSSAEVYLFGATVTSWRSGGRERLFVSSLAKLDGSKPVRGGIPLVFPQFGPGDLPQHGFARTRRWTLFSAEEHGQGVVVNLQLKDDADTRASKWPFKFDLLYTIDLTATTLSTVLRIENVDSQPFSFTSLMHTYLRVSDIATTAVGGLKGVVYADKVKGTSDQVEQRDEVTVAANEDRVYTNVPGIVTVTDGGEKISIRRFNYKDIVLWNPWAEKAAEMSDFANEEYPQMICVEAGTVAGSISLSPGQTISCGQILTAESTSANI